MKSISFDNERIQNTALFFVQNTEHVGITKLCKLFYFFDMDVYKETGFTATGLTYYAKKQGPVPMSIWAELQNKKTDGFQYFGLTKVIKREPKKTLRAGEDELFFVPVKGASFKRACLSEKEITFLNKIVTQYKMSSGNSMSEKSHLKGTPWEQTWDNGNGDGVRIDFDLEATLYYDTEKMNQRYFVQQSVREFLMTVEAL